MSQSASAEEDALKTVYEIGFLAVAWNGSIAFLPTATGDHGKKKKEKIEAEKTKKDKGETPSC